MNDASALRFLPLSFLILICLSYLLSAISFSIYLKRFSRGFLRIARWQLTLGLALHWGFLIHWFETRHLFVPSNSLESILSISAILAILAAAISCRKALILVVPFLLFAIVLGILPFFFLSETSSISSAASTPWLWTHIVLTVLGEAFFVFAAIISFVYLGSSLLLKKRLISQWFSRLPSLSDFDIFLGEILFVGFILLSLGILMGFVFAEEYWKPGWFWDPKVIFCLLSWAIYGVLLSSRWLKPQYHGEASARISIVGFLITVFLSLGVANFLPSQHKPENPKAQESGGDLRP